jgi:hypothetical protein
VIQVPDTGSGPPLLLVSYVAPAFAANSDPGAVSPPPSAISTTMPSGEYWLSLGSYEALLRGAYLPGKGVKVTVQIGLSERDRKIIEKIGKEVA